MNRLKWGGPLVFAALAGILSARSATPETNAIELVLPIDCEIGRSCFIQNYVDRDSTTKAADYQCGTLTYDNHDGTDFRLPTTAAQRAGVNVRAAADGAVVRSRDNMPDIPFNASGAPPTTDRECGNGALIVHRDGWQTQYCHLAQGSLAVKQGDRVTAGQAIGRVGLSGRSEFPHLHLTVRHQGRVVDPFAFGAAEGACGGGASLWNAALRGQLAYRARAVLNAGFAGKAITMDDIESGQITPPTAGSDALVAFVRAIGLKGGDIQRLAVRAPDGHLFVDYAEKPLDRDKAQFMLFGGKKRPNVGWQAGPYQANYRVTRDGALVLEESFVWTF